MNSIEARVVNRIEARAAGYKDALKSSKNLRLLHPPLERFAYDAGYKDGIKALEL